MTVAKVPASRISSAPNDVGDASCLDEDGILSFATGAIASRPPTWRAEAMAHIDECDSCRLLVAEIAKGGVPTDGKSPPSSPKPDEFVGSPSRRRNGNDASREPRSSTPEAGLIDNRFRLVKPLGRGAMGTVYRAHDEELNSDVALKLLHAESAEDESSARAFARELTAGRRVTHPNVCRLHDAGFHDGAPYITMELIDGETLSDLLSREDPLPTERAVKILKDIASGLAAAHAQGIVHRDLKPANVMVESKTGRAILTDFGFAADMDSKQSRRLVGTPSFWAPEQARGESATPASDVYSFGLLAYRLLVGREFSISDERALEAVPQRYRRFVRICVEARPSARPANASIVFDQLERLGGRSSRSRILAVAGGALGVLMLVLAARSFRDLGKDARRIEPSPMSSVVARPPVVDVPKLGQTPAAAVPTPSSQQALPPPQNLSHELEEKKRHPATAPPLKHPADGGFRLPASVAPPPSAVAPPPSADPLYRH